MATSAQWAGHYGLMTIDATDARGAGSTRGESRATALKNDDDDTTAVEGRYVVAVIRRRVVQRHRPARRIGPRKRRATAAPRSLYADGNPTFGAFSAIHAAEWQGN
jgi:hypothetical protein